MEDTKLSAKKRKKGVPVVVLHNHPSTQNLCLENVRFFLHFESVKVMVVVTNQGIIRYLCKDKGYDYFANMVLYKDCIAGNQEAKR